MRFGRTLLAAALAFSLVGSAQAATPRERQEAAVLSNKAKAAARAKRHDEAADLLRKAVSLDPTPQRKIDLARSLVELSKLVEASGLLNAVANDPSASKGYREAAKKQLAQFESRIPWLSVHVAGAPSAHVEIDGKQVTADVEAPVDPGEHTVGADADGYNSGDQRVRVAEGEHKQVTITLEPIAKAPPPPPPSGGTKAPAIVAFSVGAVGIGVGAVFGVFAFDETAKAKQYCDGNKCPAIKEVVDARNKAIENGNLSTAAFVIGGVAATTGLILALTLGRSKSEPSDSEKTAITITPYITAGDKAGAAGIVGQF
ncbi:MAG: hypothetical protein IPK82_08455 [Polyangiaceae bacterium]|nr:hypothetical protein [Polyangiaceae bacterium]